MGVETKKPQRVSNWPGRLDSYVAAHRHTPFKWGKMDCLLFAAGAVVAIAERDPAKGYRGRYRSEKGAVRVLNAAGGFHRLIRLCARSIGMRPERKEFAMRGDIVTARLGVDRSPAAGVCLGSVAAFPGKDGLEFHPLAKCHRKIWRID